MVYSGLCFDIHSVIYFHGGSFGKIWHCQGLVFIAKYLVVAGSWWDCNRNLCDGGHYGSDVGVIGGEVVLLGLIALPQMLRLGYNQNLAIGQFVLRALGTMIPPQLF